MARRRRAAKREAPLDPKYHDATVNKFMNCLMWQGKKSVAERIVYEAFEQIENRTHHNPVGVFHEALKNVTPVVEVRSRRVGGATYQVPAEVRHQRARTLAIRWVVQSARRRSEKTMTSRLAAELLDASNHRGNAVRKREDVHRMAEANKAFSHYRW